MNTKWIDDWKDRERKENEERMKKSYAFRTNSLDSTEILVNVDTFEPVISWRSLSPDSNIKTMKVADYKRLRILQYEEALKYLKLSLKEDLMRAGCKVDEI